MTPSNFWASRLITWIQMDQKQVSISGILGLKFVLWIVEFWNEQSFRMIRCRRSLSKMPKLLGFWLLWWRRSQWPASRLLSASWTNTIGFALSTLLSASWVLFSPWSHWWRPRDCFCPSTSCIPEMCCSVWSRWMTYGVQWMHSGGSTEACSFF